MSFALNKNDVEVIAKLLHNIQINTEEENENAIMFLMEITDRWEAGEVELEPLMEYITGQIARFEAKTYPIEKATPVQMIRYYMEQHGHKQKDLSDIATQSVISEIFSGKRELNKHHIEKLAKKYNVTPDIFF